MAKETKGVGGVGVILLMEEIYLQGFYTSQVVGNGDFFHPQYLETVHIASSQLTGSTLLHV